MIKLCLTGEERKTEASEEDSKGLGICHCKENGPTDTWQIVGAGWMKVQRQNRPKKNSAAKLVGAEVRLSCNALRGSQALHAVSSAEQNSFFSLSFLQQGFFCWNPARNYTSLENSWTALYWIAFFLVSSHHRYHFFHSTVLHYD